MKNIAQLLFGSSRHIVCTLATSAIFAIFMIFGLSLKCFGSVQLSSPCIWALLGLAVIGFYIILSALSRILDKYASRPHDMLRKFAPYAIAAVAALVICWGAVFLASFPGYYAYDTRFFTWYLEDGTIDSSYSVLYVLFVSNIMRIGMLMFGSFDSGVAFYIAFQLVLIIAFVLYVLYSFFKSGCPRWMMVLFIAFYSLDPIIAMFANCTTRDTLFSVFFVLLSMNIMSIMRDRGAIELHMAHVPKHADISQVQASPKTRWGVVAQIASTVLLMFLCVCYRSHCVFVFLLFGVLIAFFAISSRARLSIAIVVLCILLSSLLYGFWSSQVESSMNNVENEKTYGASLCVVNMQMAYACADDAIDDTEKLAELGIDKELLADCARRSPMNSDDASFVVANSLKTPEEEREYIAIWLETVTAHPDIAINAFLQLTKGAWSPFEAVNAYGYKDTYGYNESATSLFACNTEDPAVMESKIPWLQDFLWKVSREDLLGGNPLTAWSVSTSFFLWLYIFAFSRAIATRNRAFVAACILFGCYTLSLLIGPVVMTRYYLPLYLGAPLFVYEIFKGRKDEGALLATKRHVAAAHYRESKA